MHHEFGPVDGRCTGYDAVVILWIPLGLHETLAPARGASIEIGISRRHSVHRFRKRLTCYSHLVNPNVTVVTNRLPVQPSVRAQSEAAAAALVPGIRCTRSEALCYGLIHARCVTAGKTATSGSEKPSIPVGCRYADPNPHLISCRGLASNCRHATDDRIVRIYGSGLDRRIRQRKGRQTLARPNRFGIGDERLWGHLRRSGSAAAGDCRRAVLRSTPTACLTLSVYRGGHYQSGN